MNSKQKGARGERDWRDVLNNVGFVGSKRDGQQGNGVNGNSYHPDVVCPMLPGFHWEVKNAERLNVREALGQAIGDAPDGTIPVVAWKKNHEQWTVTLNADDFLRLLKGSELPASDDLKRGAYIAEVADDWPDVSRN